MTEKTYEKGKRDLTPEQGFNLVGIDYFASPGNQLYIIEKFDMYQDALNAKKDRKNPEEYFVLYKGSGGEFFCRQAVCLDYKQNELFLILLMTKDTKNRVYETQAPMNLHTMCMEKLASK